MNKITLGQITKITNGYPFQSSKFNGDGKGLLIIRIQDMDFGPNHNSKYRDHEYSENVVIGEGDILVSLSGSFKIEKWNFGKALLNQRIIKIEPKAELDVLYMLYILKTKLDEIKTRATNTSIPNVSVNDIKNLSIPLPPLATQRAIADKLDKLQSLIDLKKQAITKTDELAKSIFLEMFGDPMKNEKGREMVKMGEVIELKYGKGLKSEDRSGEGFAVYGSNGIVGRHKEYLVKGKGIVVGRKGSIGELILTEDNFFPIDTTYYIQEKKDKYELVFLYYGLDLLGLQNMNKSAAIPGLNREDVYQRDFFLPPLPLQQKFADIITQIEAQKSEHKLALAKLEELYQAEMQTCLPQAGEF